MSGFKSTDADDSRISGTATTIEEDTKELLLIAATLRDEIISDITPYWEGPAKRRFESNFGAFMTSFLALVEKHCRLNNELRAVSAAYEKADEENRLLIAKLKG